MNRAAAVYHHGDNKDGALSFYNAKFDGPFNYIYNGRPLLQNQSLPENLKIDIHNGLLALNNLMAKYQILVVKHGGTLKEDRQAQFRNDAARNLYDISITTQFVKLALASMVPKDSVAHPMFEELEHESLFINAMYELCFENQETAIRNDKSLEEALVRMKRAAIPTELALFERHEVEQLVGMYSRWTGRIRQTLLLMLLIGGTVEQDFASSRTALDLGLKRDVQGQTRASLEPPPDFESLMGTITSLELHETNGTLQSFGIAHFKDDMGLNSGRFVADIRRYNNDLEMAMDEEDQNAIKNQQQPLRHLAWFLHGFHDIDEPNAAGVGSSHLLNCIGYLDQPKEHRSILLYHFPETKEQTAGQPLKTLSQYIASTRHGETSQRPALGDRFLLAYHLASTVFNIHTWGWVHKEISSQSVLTFASTDQAGRILPYLLRWGVARRAADGSVLTEEMDPESNIYRHPDRHGKPKTNFRNEHDIYSLGVVLLEIGMWQTIPRMRAFATMIEASRTKSRLPPSWGIQSTLLRLARSGQLQTQLGKNYATAVECCLNGTFDSCVGGSGAAEKTLEFREKVLDRLEAGIKL